MVEPSRSKRSQPNCAATQAEPGSAATAFLQFSPAATPLSCAIHFHAGHQFHLSILAVDHHVNAEPSLIAAACKSAQYLLFATDGIQPASLQVGIRR